MTIHRFLLAVATWLMLSGIASAQAYYVRVRYNTNLRASYSLDIVVIARAPWRGNWRNPPTGLRSSGMSAIHISIENLCLRSVRYTLMLVTLHTVALIIGM